MATRQGVVSATLLALAGVLFAPAFAQAAGDINFSRAAYGAELELVVSQLPLLSALLGVTAAGMFIINRINQ